MFRPRTVSAADVRDASGLNGRWIVTEAQLAGVRLPKEALSSLTLSVQSGWFVSGDDEGTLTIDRAARPAALDVVTMRGPNAGRFVPAIFEHAGGALRICYDLSGRQRPAGFATPAGSSHLLATYRRALRADH